MCQHCLQADTVQRFVVVHGQILLNQFKSFPVKAVRNSAFASALRAQMELRRHAKLYRKLSKGSKGRNRDSNPMRDRASIRARPMTATATNMVRKIWQSYFGTAPQASGVHSHSFHGIAKAFKVCLISCVTIVHAQFMSLWPMCRL